MAKRRVKKFVFPAADPAISQIVTPRLRNSFPTIRITPTFDANLLPERAYSSVVQRFLSAYRHYYSITVYGGVLMMIRRWTFLVALLLSALATASAEPTPPPMNPVLRAMANGVRDDMHARTLSLRRFDVSVDIHGSVAETTVEASFANASSEQLEGDFRLALPQGAVISGYALDISGQMTDGVLVDRPRAKA